MISIHPSEEMLALYASNQLEGEELRAVELHLDQCRQCALEVLISRDLMALEQQGLPNTLDEEVFRNAIRVRSGKSEEKPDEDIFEMLSEDEYQQLFPMAAAGDQPRLIDEGEDSLFDEHHPGHDHAGPHGAEDDEHKEEDHDDNPEEGPNHH